MATKCAEPAPMANVGANCWYNALAQCLRVVAGGGGINQAMTGLGTGPQDPHEGILNLMERHPRLLPQLRSRQRTVRRCPTCCSVETSEVESGVITVLQGPISLEHHFSGHCSVCGGATNVTETIAPPAVLAVHTPVRVEEWGAGLPPPRAAVLQGGGHYTAVVMIGGGEWWHCDDEKVARVANAERMIRERGYIVFF